MELAARSSFYRDALLTVDKSKIIAKSKNMFKFMVLLEIDQISKDR